MEEPKKRGRPPGAKNKPKPYEADRLMPQSTIPFDDYKHPDPLAMVSRLYTECDWAMQALHNSLRKGMGHASGERVSLEDSEKMARVAASLEKAIVTHGRAIKLTQALQSQKTPAELLEIAIKKIEGQTLATQRTILQRLRNTIARLGPVRVRETPGAAPPAEPTSMQNLAQEVDEEPDAD